MSQKMLFIWDFTGKLVRESPLPHHFLLNSPPLDVLHDDLLRRNPGLRVFICMLRAGRLVTACAEDLALDLS